MLSQTCARRELATSRRARHLCRYGGGYVAGTSEGILSGTLPAIAGTRARLVGAPNCAPSLCSVAGLLLALALQSGYEDTLRLPTKSSVRASARVAPPRSGPSAARHRRVFRGERFGRREIRGCRAKPTTAHFKDLEREARGVLGGAPAARARARTLPRRGHPSPTPRDGLENAGAAARGDLTRVCSAIG